MTDWSGASAIHTTPIAAYDPVRAAFQEGASPDNFGVPEATAPAILKLVIAPILLYAFSLAK